MNWWVNKKHICRHHQHFFIACTTHVPIFNSIVDQHVCKCTCNCLQHIWRFDTYSFVHACRWMSPRKRLSQLQRCWPAGSLLLPMITVNRGWSLCQSTSGRAQPPAAIRQCEAMGWVMLVVSMHDLRNIVFIVLYFIYCSDFAVTGILVFFLMDTQPDTHVGILTCTFFFVNSM